MVYGTFTDVNKDNLKWKPDNGIQTIFCFVQYCQSFATFAYCVYPLVPEENCRFKNEIFKNDLKIDIQRISTR